MLKIGLLICGYVNASLEYIAGDYPAMFRNLLGAYEQKIVIRCYDLPDNDFPVDIEECDAYITTGSSASVYDDKPWVADFELFVRELFQAKKKLVGICFGHQMIAQALGGEVGPNEEGWGVGLHSSRVVDERDWMVPSMSKFSLLVSHQDQVKILPPMAEVLAGNDFCPVSMYTVGCHFLAIQGHPEFCHEYAEALMEKRRERIGHDVVNLARESLEGSADRNNIVNWMMNFLLSKPTK